MRKAFVLLVLTYLCGAFGPAAAETVHEFTVAAFEYEGTKIWLPSTLIVHKGDRVKIKLINNVKGDRNQHGFRIAAFNVETIVTRGEPQSVEFVADKAGVFPTACQLHPAHIGGQILVLE